MITINGIQYNAQTIKILNLYQDDLIEMSSDSPYIHWELKKFPTTNTYQESVFHYSNSTLSTRNPEILNLDLTGSYYIKAIQRDSNGNYFKTDIYVRSNAMILNTSLPFSGEKTEVDSEGWGRELLQYNLELLNKLTPLVVQELNGGNSTYNGDETLVDGGNSMNSVYGYTIDGGTSIDEEDQQYLILT